MKRILAAITLAWCWTAVAADVKDLPTALQLAERSRKPVLLHFTDTNSWCKKLNTEVLDRPEFKNFADTNFIRLDIDMSHGKTLSLAQTQANSRLAEKYEVEELPAVVLINGEQKLLGKVGYLPGGPKPMITELTRIITLKKKLLTPEGGKGVSGAAQKPKAVVAANASHYELILRAITRSKQRPPSATINGEPLVQGESANLKIAAGKKAKVLCKEIRDDSVIVEVDGESEPLELQLGKPTKF